jgi:membrane protein implicated in regulation of membrane protease activity
VNVIAPSVGNYPNTLAANVLQTSTGNNAASAIATLTVAVIPPSGIPTLSEWAQLGMVLILVGVAVWHLRRRRARVSA